MKVTDINYGKFDHACQFFFFRFEPEISPVQIFLEFKRLLGLREKSKNLKR